LISRARVKKTNRGRILLERMGKKGTQRGEEGENISFKRKTVGVALEDGILRTVGRQLECTPVFSEKKKKEKKKKHRYHLGGR